MSRYGEAGHAVHGQAAGTVMTVKYEGKVTGRPRSALLAETILINFIQNFINKSFNTRCA
ncbi:MAG: hypothetical protein K0S36_1485 [Nitrosospira multiformis]|jgi:hypothetical protein|nr:hypothetical protein [Nitrosospira multiformis]